MGSTIACALREFTKNPPHAEWDSEKCKSE